ncbi:MAG TPA: hypothetical protein VNT54_13120, partial [Solirubrobacteraceae bacterium]|nr:hypothetical protein [Solirubrobacteraceae bacterium]
ARGGRTSRPAEGLGRDGGQAVADLEDRADAEGIAPIDLDERSPGVRAILEISDRLTAVPA